MSASIRLYELANSENGSISRDQVRALAWVVKEAEAFCPAPQSIIELHSLCAAVAALTQCLKEES